MINKVEIVDKGHGEVSVKIDGEEFAGKINKYSIVHSVDDVLRMTMTFPVKQLNITCLTDKMKKISSLNRYFLRGLFYNWAFIVNIASFPGFYICTIPIALYSVFFTQITGVKIINANFHISFTHRAKTFKLYNQ